MLFVSPLFGRFKFYISTEHVLVYSCCQYFPRYRHLRPPGVKFKSTSYFHGRPTVASRPIATCYFRHKDGVIDAPDLITVAKTFVGVLLRFLFSSAVVHSLCAVVHKSALLSRPYNIECYLLTAASYFSSFPFLFLVFFYPSADSSTMWAVRPAANGFAYIIIPMYVQMRKSFQLQGQSSPDQGRCPWTLLGAPPADPRARNLPFHSQIASDAPVFTGCHIFY